jgi:hypothetical protein
VIAWELCAFHEAASSPTFGDSLDARLGQRQIVARFQDDGAIQARGVELELVVREQ